LPVTVGAASILEAGFRRRRSGVISLLGVNAMRSIAMLVGLLLGFGLVAGCKQPCYITECDLDHYRQLGLSQQIENTPGTDVAPENANVGKPTTVLDPDRPCRFVTLQECIAMALEHGNVGSQSALFPGIANDGLVAFGGRLIGGDDAIRVLALDPAILATDIEASLSKFDARWQTSMTWNNTDRPVGTALDTFQAGRAGVTGISLQNATFQSALIKPLPTGGVSGITFRTDYELSNLAPRINPSYRPSLAFSFEQPLLQGFGVEINQLRGSHPGSLLNAFPTGGRVEGILITRIRFDQARAEFEKNVNFMLVNVEFAYWTLYGSYWTLYSREQALRQAFEAWRINKARYEAGRIAIQDLAQSRGQYELFRGQRITALGQVLENERQLRGLLGLPVEDCTRLIPVDQPTLAPYVPDWCTGLVEAENLRPELVLARQELKFRQLELINQKNLLLPDLRFTSSYDINSLGSRLDGAAPESAFRNLGLMNFNNWSLGLRLDVPIGFRDAHAAVRAARLQLMRSYNVLRDQELKTQRNLAFAYRRIFEFYAQIEAQRAQREAYAEQLEARFKEFLAGKGTLDFLLESQRNWADALRAEYEAIVQYNQALANFQFQKGTIMQYDNISIGEGPLPQCAQIRAVEHLRERGAALVLHERPVPQVPVCKGKGCDNDMLMRAGSPAQVLPAESASTLAMPGLPQGEAPSIGALFKDAPPLPNNGKPLPPALPRTSSKASRWAPDPVSDLPNLEAVGGAKTGEMLLPTPAVTAEPPAMPKALMVPESR